MLLDRLKVLGLSMLVAVGVITASVVVIIFLGLIGEALTK